MDVSKMSVAQLKAEAKKRGVKGFSTMKKAQLVTVLAGDVEKGIAPAKPKRKRDIDEGTSAKDIKERQQFVKTRDMQGQRTQLDVRTPAGKRKRTIVEKLVPLLQEDKRFNADQIAQARKTGSMIEDGSNYDFYYVPADAELLRKMEEKHGRSPVKGIVVKPDGAVKVMRHSWAEPAPKAGGGAKPAKKVVKKKKPATGGAKPAKRVVKKKKPTAGGGAQPKKISKTLGSISQEKIYKK